MTRRRLNAGSSRRGGAPRSSSPGLHLLRQDHHSNLHAEPHQLHILLVAGEVLFVGCFNFGGGRSHGLEWILQNDHGEKRTCARLVAGDSRSAKDKLAWTEGHGSERMDNLGGHRARCPWWIRLEGARGDGILGEMLTRAPGTRRGGRWRRGGHGGGEIGGD